MKASRKRGLLLFWYERRAKAGCLRASRRGHRRQVLSACTSDFRSL